MLNPSNEVGGRGGDQRSSSRMGDSGVGVTLGSKFTSMAEPGSLESSYSGTTALTNSSSSAVGAGLPVGSAHSGSVLFSRAGSAVLLSAAVMDSFRGVWVTSISSGSASSCSSVEGTSRALRRNDAFWDAFRTAPCRSVPGLPRPLRGMILSDTLRGGFGTADGT